MLLLLALPGLHSVPWNSSAGEALIHVPLPCINAVIFRRIHSNASNSHSCIVHTLSTRNGASLVRGAQDDNDALYSDLLSTYNIHLMRSCKVGARFKRIHMEHTRTTGLQACEEVVCGL